MDHGLYSVEYYYAQFSDSELKTLQIYTKYRTIVVIILRRQSY